MPALAPIALAATRALPAHPACAATEEGVRDGCEAVLGCRVASSAGELWRFPLEILELRAPRAASARAFDESLPGGQGGPRLGTASGKAQGAWRFAPLLDARMRMQGFPRGYDLKRLFSESVRSCCIILQRQLAISKPQAAGCWAGRLYRMLTKCLPPALADAPPGLVIPWMEFYAEYGLVNNEHLELWEKAAESLSDALLSHQDEVRLLRLHDRVPLWIVECLPEVALSPESLALPEPEPSLVPGVTVGGELQTLQETSEVTANEPRISLPMYQTSPPVPLLWHTSPETYERGLSRLGARQLVLALRYAAADGAGTATFSGDVSAQKALSEAKSQAEKRAVHFEGLSAWPKRHRSRSRARHFVAALLTHLMQRIKGVRSNEACSAVKSLASLKSLGLLGAEAAEALQALIAGPLAGWKVATGLTPSDISLLLQGMASLVAQPEGTQLEEVARNALVSGGAVALIELTACAIQERACEPLSHSFFFQIFRVMLGCVVVGVT